MNINEEIQPKKRISKKKIPKEEITEVLEDKIEEVIETVEDPEIIRKKEIADKRRKQNQSRAKCKQAKKLRNCFNFF